MKKLWKMLLMVLMMPIMGIPGGEGGEGGEVGEGGEGGEGKPKPGEKLFTQAELTARAAAEKRQGRSSAFTSVGFESEDQAKEAFKIFQALKGAKPDDIADLNGKLSTATKEKEAAATKAQMLEYKFEVVKEGVSPDNADDIVALVLSKVNDTTQFADALAKVKEKYPAMFGAEPKDTGRSPGGKRTPPPKDDKRTAAAELGKNLAAKRQPADGAKSSFFK